MKMPDSDSTVDLARVGLLVPSANIVMERDLQRGLRDVASVHTARMYNVETTAEAESRMLDEYLPRAITDIASLRPHAVVFGCTSAGALRGPAYDQELRRRIEDETGARTVSTIAAATYAVAATGLRRIAILTPYNDELNVKIKASFEEAGSEVVEIQGFGIEDSFALAEPTPDQIASRAIQLVERSKPDLLFISCTDFRALEAAPAVEAATGVPVMTSNLAVLQAVKAALLQPANAS
jgi:maleate isomerase